jgi:peptidyl-prolyl cis-trans isomerase A (cyclophilin A)
MRVGLIAVAVAACGGGRTAPAPVVISNTPEPGTRARFDALHVPTASDLSWFTDDLPGSGPLIARIETAHGAIQCALAGDEAPTLVANFVGLARGILPWIDPKTGALVKETPFYDGLTFHRVVPDFVIQGGDPAGDGTGGPGWQLADEFSDALRFDRPGVLAMANSGANTNGSQFFITEIPTDYLHRSSSIIGYCDGLDVVKTIARVPTGTGDRPVEPVRIDRITIHRTE